MRLGELCAGYGGLGLAVEEVFGADTAWFSEYDAAPSKILAHHWPNVPNYGDMTQIDWADIEHVDIISGGTPCQDLSAAGKRAGMTEGTRSNLWVQMREAIAIQKPRYVVWENVRGAYSATAASDLEQCPGCLGDTTGGRAVLRALGRVLGDLSDLGYDTQWRGLRAADVGACHGRFRVFILAAHPGRIGRGKSNLPARISATGTDRATIPHEPDPRRVRHELVANANGRDDDGRLGNQERRPKRGETTTGAGEGPGFASDAASARRAEGQNSGSGYGDASQRPRSLELERGNRERTNWGDYTPAIRRWESVMGRCAPAPTEPTGRNAGHRLSPRFTEWMMGLPDGWVTDPAIGISRNDQLKACGNGVVPQQAAAALRDMLAAFETKELAA